MTPPKSAADLAEEYVSNLTDDTYSESDNHYFNADPLIESGFLAGHAAGIAQSREMLLDAAAAIEFYNTMRGPLGIKHVADIRKALAGDV